MAVRVRLLIRSLDTNVEVLTAALVNSGYEVEEPEILLPRRLAEFMGVSLKPPRARVMVYETPFGFYHLIFSPKAVSVNLVDVCKSVGEVNVAVSEGEREGAYIGCTCRGFRHIIGEYSERFMEA